MTPYFGVFKTAMYTMVQLLGVGCATSIHSPMEGCKTFQLKPDAQGWADAIVAELFVTLMLALVVPSVVTESRRLSQFFGVAIRMCAAIGGCVTGKISERSVNPEAYSVNGISMGASIQQVPLVSTSPVLTWASSTTSLTRSCRCLLVDRSSC